MTQKETIEYNKLCAEFLGGKNHPSLVPYIPEPDDMWFAVDKQPSLQNPNGGSMWKLHELKFHSDWNWIHKVIEAIENNYFDVEINDSGCIIRCWEDSVPLDYLTMLGKYKTISVLGGKHFIMTKQEAVIQAINQFLIWYNENKTN